MPVRIKDWMIPYTWWQWIEITNNHVINVLLRKMNNLIQVNGDRELYVDLQLPSGIKPTDTFPVGVTTGKILQADWWQQSWLILNWKTTSWDYVRLIYANDGKLYHDKGNGVWVELGWWECKVNLFEMPWQNQDISDIIASAFHWEDYVTVIYWWEATWEVFYVTWYQPNTDGNLWHITAIGYLKSTPASSYASPWIQLLDISFEGNICQWVETVVDNGCKVHIFEQLPEVGDDITDLYTSVVYDERYITVIETWEWERCCWYVTGHVPAEDWNQWRIHGISYGWEPDGWQLISEDYAWLTSLDISFIVNDGVATCTWVKISKRGVRVFSVPNIWDDITGMYEYLSNTSNLAIFMTDNPLPSIFPNGTPYAIWTMSTNYISTQNTIKMYTFIPWEWPKAITVWFAANANWYECSSLALNVPATVLVDSVAPTPEQWTLWYDMSNSALKIYDWSNRQTV